MFKGIFQRELCQRGFYSQGYFYVEFCTYGRGMEPDESLGINIYRTIEQREIYQI